MNARWLSLVAPIMLASCTFVHTRVLSIAMDGDADAGTGDEGTGSAPATVDPPAIPPDAFSTLKAPADAHAELCAPATTPLFR